VQSLANTSPTAPATAHLPVNTCSAVQPLLAALHPLLRLLRAPLCPPARDAPPHLRSRPRPDSPGRLLLPVLWFRVPFAPDPRYVPPPGA
jgi:hypothetical protein